MMADWFGTNLWSGLFTICTILLMETMLSVDNAAVLSLMVKKLPKDQQPKALEYGIWGAFLLRGVALLCVSFLIRLWFLKVLGGLWLIRLCVKHFRSTEGEDGEVNPDEEGPFKWASRFLSPFWATVVLVEIMDMTFSMDNIFAVTAMTNLIGLVVVGVFIGIVCMRFVATQFIKLMERFPFLENLAFIIIGLLGVKLCLIVFTHFFPTSAFAVALESETAEYVSSAVTIVIFFLPVVTSMVLGWPAKANPPVEDEFTQDAEQVINET